MAMLVDNWADAPELVLGAPKEPVSNGSFTMEPGEPDPSVVYGAGFVFWKSGWFKVTVAAKSKLTLQVEAIADSGSSLGVCCVYTGSSVDALTLVSSFDWPGAAERVVTLPDAGAYYFQFTTLSNYAVYSAPHTYAAELTAVEEILGWPQSTMLVDGMAAPGANQGEFGVVYGSARPILPRVRSLSDGRALLVWQDADWNGNNGYAGFQLKTCVLSQSGGVVTAGPVQTLFDDPTGYTFQRANFDLLDLGDDKFLYHFALPTDYNDAQSGWFDTRMLLLSVSDDTVVVDDTVDLANTVGVTGRIGEEAGRGIWCFYTHNNLDTMYGVEICTVDCTGGTITFGASHSVPGSGYPNYAGALFPLGVFCDGTVGLIGNYNESTAYDDNLIPFTLTGDTFTLAAPVAFEGATTALYTRHRLMRFVPAGPGSCYVGTTINGGGDQDEAYTWQLTTDGAAVTVVKGPNTGVTTTGGVKAHERSPVPVGVLSSGEVVKLDAKAANQAFFFEDAMADVRTSEAMPMPPELTANGRVADGYMLDLAVVGGGYYMVVVGAGDFTEDGNSMWAFFRQVVTYEAPEPVAPVSAFYWTDLDETLLSSWSPETGEIKRLYYGDPDLPSGKQYWEFGIASWLPNGRIFLSTTDTPYSTPQGIGFSVHPSLEVDDLTVWERSSPQWVSYPMIGGVHEPVSDLFWLNWIAESSDPKYAWNGFDAAGNLVRQECEYTRFSNFVPDQEGHSGRMFTYDGWLYRPLVQESYIERFNPATLQWQWTALTNASLTVVPIGYSEAHGIVCVDNQVSPGKFYAWDPASLNWGDMPDGAFAPGDSRAIAPAHEWTAPGELVNDTRWGVATVLNGHVYYGVSGTYNTDFGFDGSGALWGVSTTVWDLDLATGVSQVLFEVPFVAIDVHGNVVHGTDPEAETEVWQGAIGLLYVGGATPPPVPVIELGPPSARRRFIAARW